MISLVTPPILLELAQGFELVTPDTYPCVNWVGLGTILPEELTKSKAKILSKDAIYKFMPTVMTVYLLPSAF